MPIGIPKVPYFLDNSTQNPWVDVYNKLSTEHILFLCSELDDELTNQLVGLFIYLNTENPKKEFFFYINSPGGSIMCGLILYDIMQYVNADISTIAVGTAASSASFILATGTKGKRVALPHSQVLLHQPESQMFGQAFDVNKEIEQITRFKKEVLLIYNEFTGQPLERLAEDIERDFVMTALQAQKYHLVDAVVVESFNFPVSSGGEN